MNGRRGIRFWVPGVPKPGGSKKGFVVPGTKRVSVVEDCVKSKDWRATVTQVAAENIQVPMAGPLDVMFSFQMPRPKGHYGTGKNVGILKASAPKYHTSKPDTTKLIRSTEDALKGIAWRDDSQVAIQHGEKAYANAQPGVWITVVQIEGEADPILEAGDAGAGGQMLPELQGVRSQCGSDSSNGGEALRLQVLGQPDRASP